MHEVVPGFQAYNITRGGCSPNLRASNEPFRSPISRPPRSLDPDVVGACNRARCPGPATEYWASRGDPGLRCAAGIGRQRLGQCRIDGHIRVRSQGNE